MLETVTKGFRAAKNRLLGKAELTPELIDESLRDIRVSLLEADVAFDVVKSFVAKVREKATGETVQVAATDARGQEDEGLARRSLREDLPRRARGPDGPGGHLARR